ncbi:hypothetical protein CIHG_02387 [Coccidioides immitis H538.4]|uniref:Uncharacterized protein n=1 Tax=Coccidioides immitis H538.4 TaxID=396776 RepID=A0A0J8UBU0_COCIT|nr:hypothetical protein CIHG_02387 [Coccidioides immitis H538.4]
MAFTKTATGLILMLRILLLHRVAFLLTEYSVLQREMYHLHCTSTFRKMVFMGSTLENNNLVQLAVPPKNSFNLFSQLLAQIPHVQWVCERTLDALHLAFHSLDICIPNASGKAADGGFVVADPE